jgi:hypothetical protein
MYKIFITYLLFIIVLCGCAKPSLVEEDKLVIIYTELVIAQDTTSLQGEDFNSIKQEIFDKYEVTEGEYNETIEYYNENPERWNEFFDKALARLETLRKTEEPQPEPNN